MARPISNLIEHAAAHCGKLVGLYSHLLLDRLARKQFASASFSRAHFELVAIAFCAARFEWSGEVWRSGK
jgi:hypothetical protein